MGLRLITPPTVEPIDLEEAKAHVFVEVDESDDQIEALVRACRARVELDTGRSLLEQEWELTLDAFPADGAIELPRGRVIAVDQIRYVDADGTAQVLDAEDWQVDLSDDRPRLAPAPGACWPATQSGRLGAVTVAYTTGYGAAAAAVPDDLRHAVKLLLGHWHANREAVVTGTISTDLQLTYAAVIDAYRIDR